MTQGDAAASREVAAARRVAADLAAYNPGHGDYQGAGRRVIEAMDEAVGERCES